MTSRNIRAIIFDMDGVVVDSMQLHMDAWKRVFADMGTGLTLADIKSDFGHSSRVILHKLLARRDHGREPGRDEIEYWFQRKCAISCQMARHTAQPIRGFPEFIRRVRARKLPVALGSAASRPFVEAVLDKLQIRDQFDAIITVDDVSAPKPDPEIFLKAAAAIHMQPKDCLIVEDSHPGIEAAVASGGVCCALLTTLQAEEIKGAPVIARNYEDLAKWLGLPAVQA